mmetsp:Transcript_6765/g.28419  ORF Transcript_6765/g.28419 Transcript_6765/m.28419 type:complete len:744 (-) Transcript_6765:569-2800(-)
MRQASSTPCTPSEQASAICNVLGRRISGGGCRRGGFAVAVVQVDGQRDRRRGGLEFVIVAFGRRVGRQRLIEALGQRGMHVERHLVQAGDANLHVAAARQVLAAQGLEHQRQLVGPHQAFLHDGGGQLGRAVLGQVAQGPEALDAVLEAVVGRVGRLEGRDDREQLGILGLERRHQGRRLAVAGRRDDLPLVDQVDIAAQRRAGPGVAGHAHAGMRQGLHAHAHLDAGCEAGLAAVDARQAEFGQPAAPGRVGQDHGLGHDQVQRAAAGAHADLHRLVAAGRLGALAGQAEVVVRPVEGLGLAAHHLALRLQVPGQAPAEGEFGGEVVVGRRVAGQRSVGDDAIEFVVPQVGGDVHPLQPGLTRHDLEACLVHREVDGHRRAVAAFDQRVGLHDLVGQHRDLPARHIHRGQALAGDLVDRRVRRDGQAGCGDVHAEHDRAAAQALHGQRVVDLRGLRVVDREGAYRAERQLVLDLGRGQRREARALGEVLEQEAFPVELVGAGDRTRRLQQVQRCLVRLLAGLDDGLVFGAILVGLEQDLVDLVLDGLGAGAGGQVLRPGLDLQGLLTLALDAQQRGLDRFLRRLLELALAGAAEVMRCVVETEQRRGLLHDAGLGIEIVAGQIGEAELALGRELPGQVQVDLVGQRTGFGQQRGGRRLLEFQQHIGRLDLDPLARVELHLQRGIGLAHHTAGEELPGIIKQRKHSGGLSPQACRCRTRPGRWSSKSVRPWSLPSSTSPSQPA